MLHVRVKNERLTQFLSLFSHSYPSLPLFGRWESSALQQTTDPFAYSTVNYQYEDRMFRTVMEGARGLARECLVQHEIKEPDSHIGDIFKEMAESGWSVASGTYGGALKVASHFLYEVTGTGKSAIMDKMLEHNGAMSHDLKVYCLENFVPLEERGLSLTLEEGDPMDGTTVESWCLNKLFMGRTRPTNSIDNEGEPNGFSASNVHRLFPCTP